MHNLLYSGVEIFCFPLSPGHVTDPWDRRCTNTYLTVLITPELFNNMNLAPGFKSPDASKLEYHNYVKYVEEKFPAETPQMSRRALALAVTFSVRRYRIHLNFGCQHFGCQILAVNGALPLYIVSKSVLYTQHSAKKCLTHYI